MARPFNFTIDRRITNRIIKFLLRYDLAPDIYYLLTVAGRVSGRPHAVPVVIVEEGDQRWLVAPYGAVDWVKNARISGKVQLKQRKMKAKFTIHELSPQDAAPILKKYVQENPITRPYFDANIDSPLSEFVEDARSRPVFELSRIKDQVRES